MGERVQRRYSNDDAIETAVALLVEELVEHDSDRIRDVLDQLTGWCAPHMKLVAAQPVSPTDQETLKVLGDAVGSTAAIATLLGVAHTTAQMRLKRLEQKGLVRRLPVAGRGSDQWEAIADGRRARAISRAIAGAGVPPAEAAQSERHLSAALADRMTPRDYRLAGRGFRFQVNGTPPRQPDPSPVHLCVGCGTEHVACCGLCPQSPEWMRNGTSPRVAPTGEQSDG